MKKRKPKRKSNNTNTVLPAVPTYTISKKKSTLLYGSIHEDIMRARVAVCKRINDTNLYKEVDEILYQLHLNCPENALKLFQRHGR